MYDFRLALGQGQVLLLVGLAFGDRLDQFAGIDNHQVQCRLLPEQALGQGVEYRFAFEQGADTLGTGLVRLPDHAGQSKLLGGKVEQLAPFDDHTIWSVFLEGACRRVLVLGPGVQPGDDPPLSLGQRVQVGQLLRRQTPSAQAGTDDPDPMPTVFRPGLDRRQAACKQFLSGIVEGVVHRIQQVILAGLTLAGGGDGIGDRFEAGEVEHLIHRAAEQRLDIRLATRPRLEEVTL